jgi:ribosomal subunit interface protein
MNLTVKGKNIDVGDSLRSHIAENLERMFEKYFSNPIEASVTLSKQSHIFTAQLSVHVGRGILLQSEAGADQAYAAYDLAAEHMAKRLRRYKRRLRDHHRDTADSYRAAQFILAAEMGVEEAEHGAANGDASPAIIAEMQTDIPTLTVGEAVMRMDLSDTKAMMFHNRAHGGLNMVYRRNDGNIGWVDPQLKDSARVQSSGSAASL